MEIVFVSSITLTGSEKARASGIGVYIDELTSELLKQNAHVVQVTGSGASADTISSKTGNNDLDKRDVRVITTSRKTSRSNLGFILKLTFKMPFIKLNKNSIIHAQRPELLLPFIWFKSKNPRVCTLHGSSYKGVALKHSSLYSSFYKKLERYCLMRAEKIIAVDKATLDEYKERYPQLTDKITVLSTGLNLELFKIKERPPLRAKYKIPKKAKVVLYVGRLEREKRLELLLKAYEDLSRSYKDSENPVVLLIVGDGRFRHDLELFAKKNKLKNVRFLGAVPHDSIPDIMNCADVFVLCSAFEGSPIVIKESLACGVPVVATKVGNIPELIEPGLTGELIVKDVKPAEISAKIKKVFKAVEENTITRTACSAKVSNFSWDVIADKMVGIYNEIG
jgi:glycosyltransferase involved in cell wall biosynthesis